MSTLYTDTDAQVEELQVRLLRQTPSWRKVEMLADLNASARILVLIGLRMRHPQADEVELRRRLAALLYGEEFAHKIYGG